MLVERDVFMEILRIVVSVIFILACIALVALVLLQEGKQAGLSALNGGGTESYWGKNKGRSMEGNLVKITKYVAIIFFLLAIVLNLSVF